MSNLIERTALAPFDLDGKAVGKGQVVTLTTLQFERAVAAGLVYRDDAMNAEVPRQDLTETKGSIEPGDGLDKHTVDALKDLAKAEGIDLGDRTRKAEIAETIRTARAAKAGQATA